MRLLLLALVLLVVASACSGQQVKILLSAHIPHYVNEIVPAEGNLAIMQAKAAFPGLGSSVYIYLRNNSKDPLIVNNISWDGSDIKSKQQAPDYQAIWWRCSPKAIDPGEEAEIIINLREALKQDTEFTIGFANGADAKCMVRKSYSGPRLTTVGFSPDLKAAYLYVDSTTNTAPLTVYVNGKQVRAAKVLGRTSDGLSVVKVSAVGGFKQGTRYILRVMQGKTGCAASIRAFGDLARFGTYGGSDPKTYSSAGFDAYNSFTALNVESLNEHAAYGMKVAMITGVKQPDPTVVGNPGLYSYIPMDEPDCHDYGKTERPIHKRIGSLAQEIADWSDMCEQIDPLTPTKVTIDLTFAPNNYFVYAKVNDISNPDCYTISLGWPLTAFRDKAAIIKRATAPLPFTMTYQSVWEEHIQKADKWIGLDQIAQIGSENLVDKTRPRGFGRAPSPEEVRIPMLYAVGSGARGLFSYIASTEASGELMNHSPIAMPELWHELTRSTRQLRMVASLLQISHPIIWAKSDRYNLWTRTLICGDNAALVVAVNEAAHSAADSFVTSDIKDAKISFPDLPWMENRRVYKVDDGKFVPLKANRTTSGTSWLSGNIRDGEVFLVCSDSTLADKLMNEYTVKAKYITPEGLKKLEEGHLKGRRTSPR